MTMFKIYSFLDVIVKPISDLLNSTSYSFSGNDVLFSFGTSHNKIFNSIKYLFEKRANEIECGNLKTLIIGTCRPSENLVFKHKKIDISQYQDNWYTFSNEIVLEQKLLNDVIVKLFFSYFCNEKNVKSVFGQKNIRFIYLGGFSYKNLEHYVLNNILTYKNTDIVKSSQYFMSDTNDLITDSQTPKILKIPTTEHKLLNFQIFEEKTK